MIRSATQLDRDAVWAVIEPVIRAGETYAIDRDISKDAALEYWMGGDGHCFVVDRDGEVLATYYLKRNQAGGGGHVANCGYMVAQTARGQGLAARMCEHSQDMARELGFAAMQFNFVVSTNTVAIALWQKFGFETVGRLPKAFSHPQKGLVDAIIMHKEL